MGQPITVVEKPSSNPAVLRFETNRPLTGMGHEHYTEPPSELLRKTPDELARRLFAAGGVQTVHVNGSVVTVTLAGGRRGEGLADVVRGLFRHYPDEPAADAAPPSDEGSRAPEATADPGQTEAAQEAEEPAAAPPSEPPPEPDASNPAAEEPADG